MYIKGLIFFSIQEMIKKRYQKTEEVVTANLYRYLRNAKKSSSVPFSLLYQNSKYHMSNQGLGIACLQDIELEITWTILLKEFSHIFTYRFILITILSICV